MYGAWAKHTSAGRTKYAHTVAIVEVRTACQSSGHYVSQLYDEFIKRNPASFNILCVAQDTLISTLAGQVTSKESDHEMPLRVEIPFLDLLLASPAVPVDAKLAAIESCRRQLAHMHRQDRGQRVLDAWLAEVAERLKPTHRTPERKSNSG
jgi:hypothetical protein